MNRKTISSGAKWENIVGYSRAVRIRNQIEVSGTTAVRNGEIQGKGDYYIQTKVIFEIIGEALSEAGASFKDVIRTRMYVKDIRQWEAVGTAHREIFGDIKPTTSMVQVDMIDPEILVEIEASAIVS